MINMTKFIGVSHLIFPIIFSWIILNHNISQDFEFWVLIILSTILGIFNLKIKPINEIIRFCIFKNKEEPQHIISNENIQSIIIKIEKNVILIYSICIITLIFILQFVNGLKDNYQWYFIQFFLFTLEVIFFSKFVNAIKTLSIKKFQ